MKTIQLKTLPLLLVELPDSAIDIKVFHDIGRPYISYFVGVETFRRYTDEDIDLIGKLSELPEEWFEKIVSMGSYLNTWWNYLTNDNHKSNQLNTPRESFYSLLEAKEQVYLGGNPCGDEAQSRTFDPERTYIFTVKTEEK